MTYRYQIADTLVEITDPPQGGSYRELADTAVAWESYARHQHGRGIAAYSIEWDENGRLIERIEYRDGRVLTNGRKAVTA